MNMDENFYRQTGHILQALLPGEQGESL